jgi:hypothetical protein
VRRLPARHDAQVHAVAPDDAPAPIAVHGHHLDALLPVTEVRLEPTGRDRLGTTPRRRHGRDVEPTDHEVVLHPAVLAVRDRQLDGHLVPRAGDLTTS